MTVKELREALAPLADDLNVAIWLPGSRVDLLAIVGPLQVAHDPDPSHVEVLIEGNLRSGSVLS